MRYVAAVALLVGCYAPKPPAGAPCANGACPAGLVCAPATQTCEVSANPIDAPRGPDAPPDVAADANVDANTSTFLHRRRITIHNSSTSQLPAGFTITVPFSPLATLVSTGSVKPDFSDLRIIGDTVGERDRIVDPPGGPAPVAIHFSLGTPIAPGATSNEYAIYYSYPAAPAAPAVGTNVFPVYEDFTTAISNVWMQHDAPQVTGGNLVLRAGHTDAITTTASADNVPIISAMSLVATVPNPASDPTVQPEGTFWYWFGYQHTGDFTASDPWIVWISRGKNGIGAEQKSPVGCETGCSPTPGSQDTATHYYRIERDPGETRFYRDGAVPITITVQNTEDYSLMLRNYMATSDLVIDYVRARARVSPDPTVSLGPEETL